MLLAASRCWRLPLPPPRVMPAMLRITETYVTDEKAMLLIRCLLALDDLPPRYRR